MMDSIFNLSFLVLVFFLIFTNPERSELNSHVLESFKFSFYRGISNFLNINVRSSFSRLFSDDDRGGDDNYVNALLFSYVYGSGDKLYLGIGGIWIDPSYWSTLSGYVVIGVCCLTLFRIVTRTRRLTELSSLTQAIIPFILFSATVEMGLVHRRKMAIFLVITSVFSLLTMRITQGKTASRLLMREIPAIELIRCCASGLLAFLTRTSSTNYYNSLKYGYTSHPALTVSKTFRWHGCNVEYSQALLLNVVVQMLTGDYPGLVSSATGAVMQEIMMWLTH